MPPLLPVYDTLVLTAYNHRRRGLSPPSNLFHIAFHHPSSSRPGVQSLPLKCKCSLLSTSPQRKLKPILLSLGICTPIHDPLTQSIVIPCNNERASRLVDGGSVHLDLIAGMHVGTAEAEAARRRRRGGVIVVRCTHACCYSLRKSLSCDHWASMVHCEFGCGICIGG